MMVVDKLKMADKSGEEGTVMVMVMRLVDREMALMKGMVMMMRVVDREMTLIEGMDMLRMVDKKMDYVKQQGKVVAVDKQQQVLLDGDNLSVVVVGSRKERDYMMGLPVLALLYREYGLRSLVFWHWHWHWHNAV